MPKITLESHLNSFTDREKTTFNYIMRIAKDRKEKIDTCKTSLQTTDSPETFKRGISEATKDLFMLSYILQCLGISLNIETLELTLFET